MILVLLCAVLFVIVMQGPDHASDHGNWSVSGDGPVSNIYLSEDGTAYLFGGANGNTIYALGPDGDKKWAFEVTGPWLATRQVFAVDDGTIYLCLCSFDNATAEQYGGVANYRAVIDQGYIADGERSIIAISETGKKLWQKEVPNATGYYGISIYADNGRLYYYNNETLTVYDKIGRTLFNVTGLYGAPTIDEHGDIFTVEQRIENGAFGPGDTIDAYYPNGTLYWRNDLGHTIYGIIDYAKVAQFNTILRYQDDSLYAWVENGTVRLSANGSIIWSKTFPYNGCMPLSAMPIDSQGNMYYLFFSYPQYIDVVTPDGREILRDYPLHNATFGGIEDGVIYYVDYYFDNSTLDNAGKENLVYANISAYDILGDRYLWNFSLSPEASEILITGDNALIAGDNAEVLQAPRFGMFYGGTNMNLYQVYYGGWSLNPLQFPSRRNYDNYADEQFLLMRQKGLYCNWGIRLARGTDTLYLNYYAFNWQPTVFNNKTACLYANSLYAIAGNGTLLWEKPLSSPVTAMAVNNSTLYYSTRNGGFYVENAAKIGGGLALLAMVYLAARFLIIGSVARARSRLDKNENRNQVMRDIADNPGLTSRDIARDLGVNLGTIRYHLLILGMNHKIVTYQADGKHVRFFTNSKSYSEAEQQAVSLVRREGMRMILELLLAKPGVTSRELSLALDAQESAVSRNLRELLQKGIVNRNAKQDGGQAYFISEGHRAHIAFAIERVKK